MIWSDRPDLLIYKTEFCFKTVFITPKYNKDCQLIFNKFCSVIDRSVMACAALDRVSFYCSRVSGENETCSADPTNSSSSSSSSSSASSSGSSATSGKKRKSSEEEEEEEEKYWSGAEEEERSVSPLPPPPPPNKSVARSTVRPLSLGALLSADGTFVSFQGGGARRRKPWQKLQKHDPGKEDGGEREGALEGAHHFRRLRDPPPRRPRLLSQSETEQAQCSQTRFVLHPDTVEGPRRGLQPRPESAPGQPLLRQHHQHHSERGQAQEKEGRHLDETLLRVGQSFSCCKLGKDGILIRPIVLW